MTYVRVFSAWRGGEVTVSSAVVGKLFTGLNQVGALTASIGLMIMLLEYQAAVKWPREKYVYMETVLITLPYVIIGATWLFRAYRRSGLMDEKQREGVRRAGATAWLVSIPLMGLFLFGTMDDGSQGSLLWFPVYLFTTLFIFSVSSLWYYQRTLPNDPDARAFRITAII